MSEYVEGKEADHGRAHSHSHRHGQSHAHFDDLAAGWDADAFKQHITDLTCGWVKRQPWWAPPLEGPAMEYGCGTGLLTMRLLGGLGSRVVGVDPSEKMLEQMAEKAQKLGEGDRIVTRNAELTGPGQLGEGADASFLLIYSQLVLHHIRDCAAAVSTMAGYLRPGGRLVLFDFEATENASAFHPSEMKIGETLEHHGICASDLLGWLDACGQFESESIKLERLPFQKPSEAGEGAGAEGRMEHFQMLAVTAVKHGGPASGASAGGAQAEGGQAQPCLGCKKSPAEYKCAPCGCLTLCRPCAMKVATGGRCKTCKAMFTELTKVR